MLALPTLCLRNIYFSHELHSFQRCADVGRIYSVSYRINDCKNIFAFNESQLNVRHLNLNDKDIIFLDKENMGFSDIHEKVCYVCGLPESVFSNKQTISE